MSYCIQGPELEGETKTIEVPHPPADCPLCGCGVDVTSDESGMRAWVYINCRVCRLQLISKAFNIYYHCACDEFRRICEQQIARWNERRVA